MKNIREWFDNLIFNFRYKHTSFDKFLFYFQLKREERSRKKKLLSKEKKGITTLFSFIILSILFIILVMVATYFWFTTAEGTIPVGSDLIKSDWLTFWGGFLGFLGTCLLGGLSIWQNYRLDRVNKRLTEQNAISTFHSFLIPESIIIDKEYFHGRETWKLDDNSYQQMFIDDPDQDPMHRLMEFSKISIIFINKTDFVPVRYLVNTIKFFYFDHESKEVLVDRSRNYYYDDIENYFMYNPENNTDSIILHFPIYGGEKQKFEKLLSIFQFNLDIDFSYINPFNVVVHSKISIAFETSYNGRSVKKLDQKKIFLESFECFYSDKNYKI